MDSEIKKTMMYSKKFCIKIFFDFWRPVLLFYFYLQPDLSWLNFYGHIYCIHPNFTYWPWTRIFKLLRTQGVDSTVLIPPDNQFSIGSEPEFVNLLRSPVIDYQFGRIDSSESLQKLGLALCSLLSVLRRWGNLLGYHYFCYKKPINDIIYCLRRDREYIYDM